MANIPLPDTQVGKLLPQFLSIYSQKANDTDKYKTVKQPLDHQRFVQRWIELLNTESSLRGILLYHQLGTGKTCTSLFAYNKLFHLSKNWNVFILIKNTLSKTWENGILECLEDGEIRKNITIINYDGKVENFLKKLEEKRRHGVNDLFIIDEVHNLITNAVNNIYHPNERIGRGIIIYRKVQEILKSNPNSRILAVTATPAINTPFELGMLFNLIHPNLFPESIEDFDQLFLPNEQIQENRINLFQRRIAPYVSYVVPRGSGFALRNNHLLKCRMSKTQDSVYRIKHYHEQKVKLIQSKQHGNTGQTAYGEGSFNIFTRQACNGIIPNIDSDFNSSTRHSRAIKENEDVFNTLTENQLKKLQRLQQVEEYDGDLRKLKKEALNEIVTSTNILNAFMQKIRSYWEKMNLSSPNLQDDLAKLQQIYTTTLDDYRKKHPQENYHKMEGTIAKMVVTEFIKTLYDDKNHSKFSLVLVSMFTVSIKMLHILLMIFLSPGITIVYSNWVHAEGLQYFKEFIHIAGMTNYREFNGDMSIEERAKTQELVNASNNKNGKKYKILLLSVAGSEGISIHNVRQIHIIEPYFQQVRSIQVCGRGIRQYSHNDLPESERVVDVFEYLAELHDNSFDTIDLQIYDKAMKKQNTLNAFLTGMQRVAIDCNRYDESGGKFCFRFEDDVMIKPSPGAMYLPNIEKDLLTNSGGSGSENTKLITIEVEEVKVIRIKNNRKSKEINALLDRSTGYVYLPNNQIIGTILYDINGIPVMQGMNVYTMKYIIEIYSDIFL